MATGTEREPKEHDRSFIDLLDRDPVVAEQKYGILRENLCYFFRNRGHKDPECLAQETLFRAVKGFARKIPGGLEGDPGPWVLGIARHVHADEMKRLARTVQLSADHDVQAPRHGDDEGEIWMRMAKPCLDELPVTQRQFMVEYADNLRTSASPRTAAQRVRAHAIRRILEACMKRRRARGGEHDSI